MKTEDFYYDLPEELIAQHPIKDRKESKLLLLDKGTGKIEDRIFKDIINYLNPGDCLVLNDTKVIPARLFGGREGKDEKIEFLLLRRIEKDIWETLVRPGKKVKPSNRIVFGNGLLMADVLDIEKDGTRKVKFSYNGIFEEILDELGEMPLPPYIKEKLEDKERYQTVYSKYEGSAAAPTAGLHFTKDLLNEIEGKGVNIAYLTLHVGLGTFRPVKVENIEEHHMHSEYYEVSKEAAEMINRAKKSGGRIIAVGTTTTRTLESIASKEGEVLPQKGWTDIFIYPGYDFKIIDGLITNFHLPESTLLMLVSALAGKDNIFMAYRHAIDNRYRFFSFGDAMFIK
ncbi:tRNA preQ1(34) S-adenosylmethionine ribosyltransferase-isomerase QueA [Clostridium sp. Cult2]|uniref:tRNA preQ1(34) S-adenosylmethionine ribosyltransferase-isomerase QueA n=1 Tax=Clostridium sp. Cult2 TaxID=2079003 RepID=UPI001F0282AF|nr:tRNA preQ1(34) S-adenosylmethionine ribosyltransferase-isomerase QueA [Clostridium sp. Cult2]MCF6465912.1 tRNA preQ1(34) S-adenosylmethionine ribosyltransferase-isomerase QueA [Clostridium sp. Cult2]